MIARHSLHWIILPLVIALILFVIFNFALVLIFILISIFFIVFFRDPERRVGEGIVAPADGKISNIEYGSDMVRISIIMGLHNVHVNRAPIDGKLISIEHIKGKHIPAFKKDSEVNERVVTIIKSRFGKVKLVLIAGAFARRIVPYIRKGNKISKGQRIGIIKFGSRVDLYLPKNRTRVLARVGVKVRAGESCLAMVVENEI